MSDCIKFIECISFIEIYKNSHVVNTMDKYILVKLNLFKVGWWRVIDLSSWKQNMQSVQIKV